MRFVDAVLCFPTIFLLLALAAFIEPTLLTITVIIAATAWMEVARLVEAQIRALRDRDFAVAAMALGAPDYVIMFRELIPNALAPIVVAATLNVARAILLESYISFLGYGIQPPIPSWGNMLNNAQDYLVTAPWLAICRVPRSHWRSPASTSWATGFAMRSIHGSTSDDGNAGAGRVGSASALQHRQRRGACGERRFL